MPPANEPAPPDAIVAQGPSSWRPVAWLVATGFVFVNTLLLLGAPVPHANEYVYLVRLRVADDPSFLRGDWTFSGSFSEHAVFDRLVSPIAGVVPVEVLGWAGRLVLWAALALALLLLAHRLGVALGPAAVAIVLTVTGQLRIVGQDWLFGTFEAKPVAYLLLFGAILLTLRGRVVAALVAAGLVVSFHPGVGALAIPPLIVAMALEPRTRRDTLRWCWVAVVSALPGVLALDLSGTSTANELWDFMTHKAHPFHLDPYYFGIANFAVLVVMFACNIAYYLVCIRPTEQEPRAWRFVTVFQVLLALPALAGVVAFTTMRYEYLRFYPFRVFPLLVVLFFFFMLADAWQRRRSLWRDRRDLRTAGALVLIALAVLGIAVVWNPVRLYAFSVREHYREWTATESELDQAMDWVAAHVPEEAVVILPPGADDTFYRAERPQIGTVKALRADDVAEWRERVEDQFADGFVDDVDELFGEDDLLPGYAALTEADVIALERRYGAEYMVSPTRYDFDVVHRAGDFRVYALPSSR